eukprot:COSAG06_NODE_770_length_12437_cov_27.452423_10_plen_68_part_00
MVFYQIPKGLGIAASIRCGNALGAGRPAEAKSEAFMGAPAFTKNTNALTCCVRLCNIPPPPSHTHID